MDAALSLGMTTYHNKGGCNMTEQQKTDAVIKLDKIITALEGWQHTVSDDWSDKVMKAKRILIDTLNELDGEDDSAIKITSDFISHA